MYTALDVAAYVINRAIRNGTPVSNLSLQKILYYIQAAFLVEKGEPIFYENICAWKYGPVVEEVYHEYKRYASSEIVNEVRTKLELQIDGDVFRIVHIELNPEASVCSSDQDIIDRVIMAKCKYSALQLVSDTHNEDPWVCAVGRPGEIITNESIEKYFCSHPERIWN